MTFSSGRPAAYHPLVMSDIWWVASASASFDMTPYRPDTSRSWHGPAPWHLPLYIQCTPCAASQPADPPAPGCSLLADQRSDESWTWRPGPSLSAQRGTPLSGPRPGLAWPVSKISHPVCMATEPVYLACRPIASDPFVSLYLFCACMAGWFLSVSSIFTTPYHACMLQLSFREPVSWYRLHLPACTGTAKTNP